MGLPGNLVYKREHGFFPVILYTGESMGFPVILHAEESMGIPVILRINGTHLRGRADSNGQKLPGHADRARCLNMVLGAQGCFKRQGTALRWFGDSCGLG